MFLLKKALLFTNIKQDLIMGRKHKVDEHTWMSEEEYQLVTGKSVIPCVDLVILRKDIKGDIGILLLIRKTGYGTGGWCLIGGRQWKGETAEETIDRQARDVGIKVETIPPFQPNFPAWINDDPNQDKTKHPCSMTYPVKIISGQVRDEGEEYKGWKWFSVKEIPKMNYGHRFQVLKTLEQLKKFNALNEI